MAEIITDAERKRRLIVLVISIFVMVLSLVIGGYSLVQADKIKQGKDDNNQPLPDSLFVLRGEVAEKEAKVDKLQEEVRLYVEPWGWKTTIRDTQSRFMDQALLPKFGKADLPAGHPDTMEPITRSVMEYLDMWAPELKSLGVTINEGEWFKLVKKKKFNPQTQKEEEVEEIEFAGADNKLFVIEFLKRVNERAEQYRSETSRLKQEADPRTGRLREEEKQVLSEIRRQDAEALKALEPLITQYTELLKQLNSREKDHFQERQDIENQLREKRLELETMRAKFKSERTALEMRRQEIQTRINHIKFKREEAEERKEPDGTVVSVDLDRQLVYINLTKKDRLFRFMRFNVFAMEKGMVKVDRGVVELIDIGEEYSVCAIVRQSDPKSPMKKGDLFYNTYYDRNVPNHVVIAGRLTKYSRDEVAQKLRELGDVYQERVDDKTNYCIVGEGYENDPVYIAARDMGVRILVERYVYEYLGFPE